MDYSKKMKILLQNSQSYESRAVVQAVAIIDGYELIRIDISDLEYYFEELETQIAVPIGSVEFIREAFRVSGINEPNIDPYPIELNSYLHRNVKTQPLWPFYFYKSKDVFIHPMIVKQFDGFVFKSRELNDYIEPTSVAVDTMIYVSDVVNFESEYRYYVQHKELVGFSRYDEHDNDLIPDLAVVTEAISKLSIVHPYVLDFGVLSTGETALVEYNDFWAIGLYSGSISNKKYLEMLVDRWLYFFK